MNAPHYKAFISYSHEDEAWARWLQKSLESYRVPKRLVGSQGRFGAIQPRLGPIFRDREDLSSASDLTESIKNELAASETLIVICSPAAAASRWVNEEIRYFHELGRGDRILALIVDGDPLSTDPAGNCFPEALVRNTDGRAQEPLAADARKYADGRRLARLKLVAGILGIRLDELRRRDAQRRTRRRVGWTLVVLALAALVGWLGYSTVVTQEAARRQRANTEELLGFMLGDLKRLDPIVGLELVDDGDMVLSRYRDELGFAGLSDQELVDRALAWRDEGIEHHDRGNLADAMDLFQQSRAALVELHRREGSTTRTLFELGQAEFWVGYVYMDRGDLDEAQASFARYGAITRRLVNADPNNARLVMELAYSLGNLGALERVRRNPDTGKILQLFQSAVQYNQMALVLDSENDTFRRDLSISLAFLADAWLETCNLGNAFSLRMQNVALARELFERSPTDPFLQEELAYALSGLAGVQRSMGLNELAAENLTESGALLRELHQADPGNATFHWQALLRDQRLARLAAAQGRTQTAWAAAQPLMEEVETYLTRAPGGDFTTAVEAAQFRADYALLALKHGRSEAGMRILRRAVADLADRARQNPDHRGNRRQLAHTAFAWWENTGTLPGGGVADLLDGYLSGPDAARSCSDASLAARLALLRGDRGLASRYTEYLLNKGYFEPAFVSFCRAHGLCDLEPEREITPANAAVE